MNKALFACLAFVVFACYSCSSAGTRTNEKIAAIENLRAEAAQLAGQSSQIEKDRPGLFSFFASGFVDGVAIGSIGLPVGALAMTIENDASAGKKQQEIVRHLRLLEAQEQGLLAEARSHFDRRRFWMWSALAGVAGLFVIVHFSSGHSGAAADPNRRQATS